MLFKRKSFFALFYFLWVIGLSRELVDRIREREITGIILEGDLAGGGVNQNASVSMFMQTPRYMVT